MRGRELWGARGRWALLSATAGHVAVNRRMTSGQRAEPRLGTETEDTCALPGVQEGFLGLSWDLKVSREFAESQDCRQPGRSRCSGTTASVLWAGEAAGREERPRVAGARQQGPGGLFPPERWQRWHRAEVLQRVTGPPGHV